MNLTKIMTRKCYYWTLCVYGLFTWLDSYMFDFISELCPAFFIRLVDMILESIISYKNRD